MATGLEPGLSARVTLRVTEADTAQALGSGDVPVLGTPRLLALAEAATVRATARHLPAGSTTVGTRVELEHLAATPVGGVVSVVAQLSTVDGHRLGFTVSAYHVSAYHGSAYHGSAYHGSAHDGSAHDGSAHDGETLAARGTVERVLVNRERFVAKATGTGGTDR
jgi:predicted thioesterase